MSIRKLSIINPSRFHQNKYQLDLKNNQHEIEIKMYLLTNYFHTLNLPHTHQILKSDLPDVLKTKCFNDSNLPFSKEVRNTEIGHLFEHILLQYLCQVKIKNGFEKVTFRGVTKWNWKKEERGTFNISIEIEPEDVEFFHDAFSKTINLFNKIMLSENSISRLIN